MDIKQLTGKYRMVIFSCVIILLLLCLGVHHIHSEHQLEFQETHAERVLPRKRAKMPRRVHFLLKYINDNYDNQTVQKVVYTPKGNHIKIYTPKRLNNVQKAYVKSVYHTVQKNL